MAEEFEKIQQDINDFNTRIKSWNLEELSDEEAEEIGDKLEETMALLAGEEFEDEDDGEESDL